MSSGGVYVIGGVVNEGLEIGACQTQFGELRFSPRTPAAICITYVAFHSSDY